MNIKEYILSGIVESYVMGLASEPERLEFEKLCHQYPELVAARKEFEEKLEQQAFDHAITPPVSLKEKIQNRIHEQPHLVKEARVITMDTRPRNNSWLKYVTAASVILLLGSSWFIYDLYSKNQNLQNSISEVQSQLDSLNGLMAFERKMMKDPNITVVSLVGTQQNRSSANIYWDTTSSNVFMVIKNMPKLPTEKQYQLWAFIEGRPIDLGLFDGDENNVMLKMKNTRKAQAFAITIEKRGNGPIPQGELESKTDL